MAIWSRAGLEQLSNMFCWQMLAQNVRFYGMAQWLGGDIFDQSLCVLGREDTDLCVHQVARCDVIMFWMVLNTVTWCLERKNTLNSSFSSASRRHRKRCAKPKTVTNENRQRRRPRGTSESGPRICYNNQIPHYIWKSLSNAIGTEDSFFTTSHWG